MQDEMKGSATFDGDSFFPNALRSQNKHERSPRHMTRNAILTQILAKYPQSRNRAQQSQFPHEGLQKLTSENADEKTLLESLTQSKTFE